MKKVLYAPGIGHGWSTANIKEIRTFMAEYEPIIKELEKNARNPLTRSSPVIKKMLQEIKTRFNVSHVNLQGLNQLTITVVYGYYRINEYKGSESVEEIEGEE